MGRHHDQVQASQIFVNHYQAMYIAHLQRFTSPRPQRRDDGKPAIPSGYFRTCCCPHA